VVDTIKDRLSKKKVKNKTAQNIIEYRKQHKRFGNINELLSVKGIGEAKLAKIKKYIFID